MNTLLHARALSQIEAITATSNRSYVFHGARSLGKATAAAELARALNCQGHDGSALCGSCKQFEAGTYPDLITIGLEDRASIVIEQIRGLVQTLSLSSYYSSGVRVVIIDDAHLMTTEAQNALLKLIEEPPPHTIFILVAERLESLLVTVRSRCQAVHFAPPGEAGIAGLLERQLGLKPSDASRLAAAASGAPGLAFRLATDPAEAEARLELARLAVSLPAAGRFERLLAAGRLITAKADLWQLSRALQAQLTAQLRTGAVPALSAARSLQALELFRRQLNAKVSARVALERLMLEL